MNVTLLPGDAGGCGFYRVTGPGRVVSAIRPGWNITTLQPKGDLRIGLDRSGRVVEVEGLPPTDVLVMQRTGTRILSGVAKWAQSQGIAVVIDFDDAMWCIDKDNSSWSAWNLVRNDVKRQHWKHCDEAVQWASLVTVTTEGLARRYAQHGRVEVIGNYVPQAALDAPSWRGQYVDIPAVGWAGFTATHPRDASVSAPAARAAVERGAIARVVADASGVQRDWNLPIDPVPSQALGPDYYSALSTLDLMLVGLRDIPFNQCKSTLKVLEAAAAGVPSIAAATKPHRQLKRDGFPVALADSPAEWERLAIQWVESPGLQDEWRLQVAEVISAWTMEANAERWAQAWERAARLAI